MTKNYGNGQDKYVAKTNKQTSTNAMRVQLKGDTGSLYKNVNTQTLLWAGAHRKH